MKGLMRKIANVIIVFSSTATCYIVDYHMEFVLAPQIDAEIDKTP